MSRLPCLTGVAMLAACAARQPPHSEPVALEVSSTTLSSAPFNSGATVPPATEFVTVRVFLIDADAETEAVDLPASIRASDVCAQSSCDVVLSPLVVGRAKSTLAQAMGDREGDQFFTMQVTPTVTDSRVDLALAASLMTTGDAHGRPYEFEFAGTLDVGVLTHLGALHLEDHRGSTPGPHIFVTVEPAS